MRKNARPRELYSIRVLITYAALCLAAALPARAESILDATTGMNVTVSTDGTYTIHSSRPFWTFSGILAGGAKNIAITIGKDNAGDFQEIVFDERAKSARHLGIRTWSGRPGVLFTQTVPASCSNPPAFPNFSTHPDLPYDASFAGTWSALHFDLSGREGPWVFFNDAAETAILSPAANFMVARLTVGAAGELQSRIDGAIATLPQNHSHATLLVVDRGINHAFETWGHLLTDVQGKVRPAADADATLKYLGYWTDNGAAYYYNFDQAMGYEGTLLGVRDDFARMGLPIGYLQLDSWWYRKGESGDWNPQPDQWNFGISTYEAHPDLFPNGLASFSQRIGVPLVTHARWIDVRSPYRTKYRISNNVAVDPKYWDEVAAYLKQSGVTTYEQDWLDSRATADFKLDDQNAFMDNMARALSANGITMEYCMPTPRHVLQGSKYSNLTSVRVSTDHFERALWPQVIYASRLASAVGEWPWVDVFASSETANLMIATLSAGVVGASDAIGAADVRNLRRAARPDGVLVKPDVPLVPTDSTFIAEAQDGPGPMVAYTYSEAEAGRAVYVVSFGRGSATPAVLNPAETGLSGSVYAYDTRNRTGDVVDASRPMTIDLTNDWASLVLVPIRHRVALIGDTGKFAPRGHARIASVKEHDEAIETEIAFAAGEDEVTLTGYSAYAPIADAASGRVSKVTWDAATQLFHIVVAPPAHGVTARVSITAPLPRVRAVRK